MSRNNVRNFKSDNVIDLREHLECAFQAAYLAELGKSDFEVISDICARDIKLIRTLPRMDQLKLGAMLRDAIDEIQGSVVDTSD
jgi:hypothetical protein